jgi:hypothetical protein
VEQKRRQAEQKRRQARAREKTGKAGAKTGTHCSLLEGVVEVGSVQVLLQFNLLSLCAHWCDCVHAKLVHGVHLFMKCILMKEVKNVKLRGKEGEHGYCVNNDVVTRERLGRVGRTSRRRKR